jgi:hypothetical protein
MSRNVQENQKDSYACYMAEKYQEMKG